MLPVTNSSDKSSILKSTREARGLTLEIVHEATKIPMDALRAIEEGYSSRILSPFYYRGFIKIYSEFLGLNVEEMYKHYDIAPAVKSTALPVSKVSHENQPNVFLEQLQEWAALVLKSKNFKIITKVLVFVVAFFLVFKIIGYMASHMPKKQPASKRAVLQQDKKVKANDIKESAVKEEKNTVNSSVNNQQALSAKSYSDKVELGVRAVKDTWLRVKADEKVVFQSTLSKGSVETWSAERQIELSGKEIERLDIEVNNKHIGFLGGGERRVRRVLITKEGLTVKK